MKLKLKIAHVFYSSETWASVVGVDDTGTIKSRKRATNFRTFISQEFHSSKRSS